LRQTFLHKEEKKKKSGVVTGQIKHEEYKSRLQADVWGWRGTVKRIWISRKTAQQSLRKFGYPDLQTRGPKRAGKRLKKKKTLLGNLERNDTRRGERNLNNQRATAEKLERKKKVSDRIKETEKGESKTSKPRRARAKLKGV